MVMLGKTDIPEKRI